MKKFEAGPIFSPPLGSESKKKPEDTISDFAARYPKAVEIATTRKEIAEKTKTMPIAEPSSRNEAADTIREKFEKLRDKKENPEHIPTSEEVQSLFEKIVGEAKYETRRKLEDEQGLYLWEIEIAQEDGVIEYSYTRKGDYKARGLAGGSASETAIHITYFDNDGVPISGTSVLKLVDNKWVEIP